MHDRRALVLDEVHSGLLGDAPGLAGDDAELKPERAGARDGGLSCHLGAVLRPAEDVDQVDRLLELCERIEAALPEHLAVGDGIDRDHPIAGPQDIRHHAVARSHRIRRGAHERDRFRVPQDLLRRPHDPNPTPTILGQMSGSPTQTEWLEAAPALVAEVARSWGLTLGQAYPPGACGHVVRVELPDQRPAVLKVSWPHRESEHEADALARWDGNGAVRLLARDDERNAMLLERCEPGTCLSGSGEALDILMGLLPRLWTSGDGFATLESEAAIWAADIALEVQDKTLRDAALRYLNELVPTQGEQVLVNQDMHGGNVLAAEREQWLVIDPKPLAGERELALAPIVRSIELGHSKREVLHRLDRLTAELDLDRDRALGWTVAQTVAWSCGAETFEPHAEVARWLLEAA